MKMRNKEILEHIIQAGNCNLIHCEGMQGIQEGYINEGKVCPLHEQCRIYRCIDGIIPESNMQSMEEENKLVVAHAKYKLTRYEYAGHRSDLSQIWSTGCIQ
jgi:hypothetical protein